MAPTPWFSLRGPKPQQWWVSICPQTPTCLSLKGQQPRKSPEFGRFGTLKKAVCKENLVEFEDFTWWNKSKLSCLRLAVVPPLDPCWVYADVICSTLCHETQKVGRIFFSSMSSLWTRPKPQRKKTMRMGESWNHASCGYWVGLMEA